MATIRTRLTTKTPARIITPGTPIQFNIILSVKNNTAIMFTFEDILPSLISGFRWSLDPSSDENFSIVNSEEVQKLIFVPSSGVPIGPGDFTATVTANTNISDAGSTLSNTVIVVISENNHPKLLSAIETVTIALCIHGSSMIKLNENQEIEISKIKSNDIILDADGKMTELVELVECWAGLYNREFGTCIIFEKDSLGEGIPSKRFAVDAGHPICTPYEYNEHKDKALKPAKLYLNPEKGIYSVTWDQVESLLPGENKRYDLIMRDDSCKAYVANGLVVRARKERKNPGYQYE